MDIASYKVNMDKFGWINIQCRENVFACLLFYYFVAYLLHLKVLDNQKLTLDKNDKMYFLNGY